MLLGEHQKIAQNLIGSAVYTWYDAESDLAIARRNIADSYTQGDAR